MIKYGFWLGIKKNYVGGELLQYIRIVFFQFFKIITVKTLIVPSQKSAPFLADQKIFCTFNSATLENFGKSINIFK